MSSIPQIPQASTFEAQAVAPAPPYTLFDPGSVALATLFGSPVAGATLMLVNDSRLGRAGRGLLMLLAATVVTGLAILAGWNIPNGASSIFGILLLVGIEPFGVFQTVVEIEKDRNAKHEGWNGLDQEQPLPAAESVSS